MRIGISSINSPTTLACLATLTGSLLQVWPNVLPPGAIIPAGSEPDPAGGTVLFTTGPTPFSSAVFSGHLVSTVLANDPGNPFGGLTFTYQLHLDATSVDPIGRFTVGRFDNFLIDASYSAFQPVGGIAPSQITRSPGGDVVGFNFFGNWLTPGSSSALLVLQTDASSYVPVSASVINERTASVPSLAPVPEPSILSLLGLALCGLAIYRWRRDR